MLIRDYWLLNILPWFGEKMKVYGPFTMCQYLLFQNPRDTLVLWAFCWHLGLSLSTSWGLGTRSDLPCWTLLTRGQQSRQRLSQIIMISGSRICNEWFHTVRRIGILGFHMQNRFWEVACKSCKWGMIIYSNSSRDSRLPGRLHTLAPFAITPLALHALPRSWQPLLMRSKRSRIFANIEYSCTKCATQDHWTRNPL